MRRAMRRPETVGEEPKVRWDEAAGGARTSLVGALDGGWKVERLSGPVPMPGVYKEVRDGRGETWAGWSPFAELSFRLEQREGSVMLIYDPPFSGIRDELRLLDDGSWLGSATVAGLRYAWFRMIPADGRA